MKENITDKEWKKYWWNSYNEICLNCKNKCKQSNKVIVSCLKLNKISEEDKNK